MKRIYEKSKRCCRYLLLLFCAVMLNSLAFAQQPAANLDQVRNGSASSPLNPIQWVNGNAGAQNAHYIEGYSIGYRVIMTAMPANTVVTITLGYDVKHSGRVAIDWLTNVNNLNDPLHTDVFGHPEELFNPIQGVAGTLVEGTPYVIPIPPLAAPLGTGYLSTPVDAWNAMPDALKTMRIWNGTITNITYGTAANFGASQTEQTINVTFTTTATEKSTVVIGFGGHIASRDNWGYDGGGIPYSAGGISGSPYHMRLKDWTLNNLGNQDRSLSAVAVYAPPTAPACSVEGDEVDCYGDLGQLTVSLLEGDAGPFSLFVDPDYVPGPGYVPTAVPYATGLTSADFPYVVSGLAAGIYQIRIVDSNSDTTECYAEIVEPDPVILTCPVNETLGSCLDQEDINDAFDAWLATVSLVGSDSTVYNDWDGEYPEACGDAITVRFWVNDPCASPDECSATFTVTAATPVDVSGPANVNASSCDYADQAALNTAFAAWKAQFVVNEDGCGGIATDISGFVAPDICAGDTITIKFGIGDGCSVDTVTATFAVSARTAVDVSGPADVNASSCDYVDQAALNAAFAAWKAQFVVNSNVCGATVTDISQFMAPDICAGDTITIKFGVGDFCSNDTVTATFAVSARTAVDVSGPQSVYYNSCDFVDQAALNAAFTAWKNQFVVNSNVCGAPVTNISEILAPDICAGDTIMIKFGVGDICSADTVTAYFGVTARPAVDVAGPQSVYYSSCDFVDQAALNAAFTAWKNQFVVNSNVCGAPVTNISGILAPDICAGDTIMIKFGVGDICSADTVTAYFGVTARTAVDVEGPDDESYSSCDFADQDALDAAFDAWIAQFQVNSNECDAPVTDLSSFSAPDICEGGTVTIKFGVGDICSNDTVTASFTVAAQAAIEAYCSNETILEPCLDSLSIEAAYVAWLAGFGYNGGCDVSDNIAEIPHWTSVISSSAGGTLTFTYKAWDNCSIDSVTCSFVVPQCEVSCETAYGTLEDENSTCFIGDGFNRWGWTNYLAVKGSYELPIYAGAANCDPTNGWGQVGTVYIEYGDVLTVKYVINAGYSMSEVHIYVGCEKYPTSKNGQQTVAPGQYTYNAGGIGHSTEYTVNFTNVADGPIYVIAHAVVCDVPGTPTAGEFDTDVAVGCVQQAAVEATKGKKSAVVETISNSALKVYPNPFNDKLYFEFTSSADTRAVLEIYNAVGQKVTTLKDGWVEKGVLNRVEYEPLNQNSGIMMYRLTLSGETQVGKVIYQK